MKFFTLLVFGLCLLAIVPAWASKHDVVRELPMPMTAPLFLESETYSSTLYLVNSLTFGVDANVSLYDMSGLPLMTKRYYLEPNAQRAIAIKQVLADGGIFSQAGSVEVVSPQNSNALVGQLSITRTGLDTVYLDEELFMPNAKGSSSQRSVIDMPQNSPIVAVTNISTSIAQVVHTRCIPSTGVPVEKVFTLRSKQTQLIRACSVAGDTVINPDQMDGQFSFASTERSGMAGKEVAGITITGDGPPSDLAAFGFVEHSDENGHYFSQMNFLDPALLASTGLVYTGLPIGKSSLLPASPYTPHVALTNFSTAPQTVTVEVATTKAAVTDRYQVAAYVVPPNSSQTAELTNLIGDPGWQNSFVIRASGKPGDVLSKMSFRGQRPLADVELMAKDERTPFNAGDHPWSVENGTQSTLFLFNHSTVDRAVTVRIGSAGSTWLKIYDLRPNETKALSINDVLTSKAPDMDGNAYKSAALTGEVSWWVRSETAPEVSGRIVQVNRSKTMARNFSCAINIAICGVSANPEPLSLILDPSSNPTGAVNGVVLYCVVGAPQACSTDNGQHTSSNQRLTWNWTSGDTSIARLVSGSNTQRSTWQGVSAGQTSAIISAGQCSGTGTVTTTPSQIPTSTDNGGNVSNGPTAACPEHYAGWDRLVTKVLLDQNGKIIFPDTSWNESLSVVPGQDQLGVGSASNISQSGVTTHSGGFQDHLSFCSKVCPGSATTKVTQAQTDIYNGTTYKLKPNNFVYSCSSNTINGN